jgi:hypothetical protein
MRTSAAYQRALMKCNTFVDLRPKDFVLWCGCAECTVHNIEDILNDVDDYPDDF